MTFPDLIRALDALGARVVVRDGRRAVDCPAANRKRLAGLREWLEAHGDAVEAHYKREATEEKVLCPLCRRDVTNPEDRERLTGINPFCDRGALPPRWKDGKQADPGQPGCPYRTS